MSSKKIDELKKECYSVYQFKDNPSMYNEALYKIEQQVTALKLDHIIDPMELSFLLFHLQYDIQSELDFQTSIDKILKNKETYFYFQLPQLLGFPNNYKIGHGKLQNFEALPILVKNFAVGLANGRVGKVKTDRERIQTSFLQEMVVPKDPNVGYWLKVSESGMGNFIIQQKALQKAEASVDILRILRPHIKLTLPQYVISKISSERTVSFTPLGVELDIYHFDKVEQELIDRLSKLVVNPSCDLEKRILNALHFYRIGRNFSSEDQELFYYVAAIENLLIGEGEKNVLRWKFSEKAAFLLSDDLAGRLETVKTFKTLYDDRSAIAHGNMPQCKPPETRQARDSLLLLIEKILKLMKERHLTKVSSADNVSLDSYIDEIKYAAKTRTHGDIEGDERNS